MAKGFKTRVARVVRGLKNAPARARMRSFRKGKKMKSLNYSTASRGGFRL